MFDDWLDVLQRGTYEIALPQLIFSRGNTRCQGSGWLTWQQDVGCKLRGTTDGAAALLSVIAEEQNLGTLIPHETFLQPEGQSQDGWSVTCTPTPVDGSHIHGPSPHVVWDTPVPGMTLRRPSDHPCKQRTLRALLSPSPDIWVRGTQTEVHHPDFGRRSGTLDWLEASTYVGRLVARQRGDGWFQVTLYLENEARERDAFEVLTAIGRAFGFLQGQRVHLRGYEDIDLQTDVRYLNAARFRPSRNQLPQPLGRHEPYRSCVESFLGPAVDFFLTACGRQVAHHLYVCWDAVDNAIQTRMTVASVAAEGLLLFATEKASPPDPGFTAQDVAAARGWLRDNSTALSPRFVQRLGGMLGSFNHRRPIDVLQDWQRRGILGVTTDDVSAWRDLRNTATHARLIEPTADRSELQGQLDKLRRVENLINRIVLMLIGYQGQYVDYASPNWPAVPFPLPEPSAI